MLGKKTTDQINAKISSIIGSDMVVEGDIKAKEAVRVEGSVTGDVETEGALVIGNIRTKSLVVDENAVFQGQCTMNTEGIASYTQTSSEPEPAEQEESAQDNKKENKWNKR